MADSSTVIGETILVNGNLQGDEDLQILGKVEGSITLSKTLHVQPSGIVKANVQVRNAIISGVVVGNITATDAVEITEQGRMVGDIKSPRVIIVEGASYRGNVDMGDMEAARPTSALPARSEIKSTSPARLSAARPIFNSAAKLKPVEQRKPEVKVEPPKAEAKAAPAKAPAPKLAQPPPSPPKPPPMMVVAKKKVVVKKK